MLNIHTAIPVSYTHLDVYKRQALHPDAFTVFIGPCMAKKKEAKEEDIADAIDVEMCIRDRLRLFFMSATGKRGKMYF